MNLIDKLRGKVTLLYGEPAVGKSFTIAKIAGKLYERFRKKAFLIWTDTNLFGEYGKELEGIAKARIYRERNPNKIIAMLKDIVGKNEQYSLIALDSVSGLEEWVYEKEGFTSPRATAILSRYARTIATLFGLYATKNNVPAFLVAHDIVLFGDYTWRGEKTRPAFSRRAIKSADVVIKQYWPADKPKWRIILYRSTKEHLEGKEFFVEDILGEKKEEVVEEVVL